MKSVPVSIAAVVTLLASPLLQSAEAPKKPAAKPATPAAKPAAPAKPETAAEAKGYPDVVAVVEGKEIKAAELQEAVAMILAQRGKSPADVPEEQRAMFFHTMLDQLILTKLVEKRAADTKVPEGEVTAEIEKIRAQLGTPEEFDKQLAASGKSLEGVKEDIRTQLRQQLWVKNNLKDEKKVTDADAEEFYKQNPNEFKQPELVRASHILIAVPQDAKPEVVVQKEKAADAVAARVKGGEDFAKVAKEVSEDPQSKEQGGDLNFFTKDKMVPEFADAAFALKKDAISAPVRSPFGYHVIKVTDRKDAEVVALDEKVKPKLIAYLQNEETKKATAKMLQALRAGAEVKVNLP